MPRRIPGAEIKKLLADVDSGLERVSRYDMLDDFSRNTGLPANRSSDDRELSRKSMRTLYTSAMFRSLPEEAQVHPAMQERVFGQLGEMDEAVFGMTDRMASASRDERETVRSRLQKDRTLPERLSQTFDRGMGRLRMPLGRRVQMRSAFAQVGFRMRTQSPTVVIDEYVTKVTKATAQVGSQVELQRRITAQMRQDAYWRYQNRLAMMFADDPGGGGTPQPGPTAAPTPLAPAPAPDDSSHAAEIDWLMRNAQLAAANNQCEAVEFIGQRLKEIDPDVHRRVFLTDAGVVKCNELRAAERSRERAAPKCDDPGPLAKKMARSKVIGTGGWMMGIGLISGVVGIAAVEATVGILLTLGVVLLVGGLIVAIVGAAMDDH